ncbi:lipocalin family protein [Silanimonas sp.]|jgi:apolipoprotein D and lipocalin family protein|uniref:lipocalin family protein n=1 Tax=Silanimonas sp. TaxID=1929290 RepID=UPI0037C7E7FE
MLRCPALLGAILALGLPLAAHAEAAAGAMPAALPSGTANAPVEALDLDRYTGRWHEVARLPMFFQRKCIGDTTATYTSRADGSIEVRNACRTDDGMIESTGAARRAGDGGALEVRFAPGWLGWLPMVWADYWVVDLDPDYQWAVVGGPGQGAMWILARETTLDPALFERIRQRAEARGYRLAELVVDPAQRDRMVAE